MNRQEINSIEIIVQVYFLKVVAPKALLQGAESLTKYRFAILRLSLSVSLAFVRLFEALEKVCAIEQSL